MARFECVGLPSDDDVGVPGYLLYEFLMSLGTTDRGWKRVYEERRETEEEGGGVEVVADAMHGVQRQIDRPRNHNTPQAEGMWRHEAERAQGVFAGRNVAEAMENWQDATQPQTPAMTITATDTQPNIEATQPNEN